MVGPKAGKTPRPAASCTECQRRKQKCSRQWPCNHCQARKIPHQCRYTPKSAPKAHRPSAEVARTTPSDEETREIKSEQSDTGNVEIPALTGNKELRALGYLPDDKNLLLGNAAPQSPSNPSDQSPETVPAEMKNVLRLLPPKPYTDILVQRFLEDTNYNYYSIYPPTFSHEYAAWWSDRASGRPLTPEFTCLLVRVCACSAQYLDAEIRQKLESELGESVQSLSESYHHAAKQLSNTIAPGKGGLTQVQQLFLMAAWFKSESLFIESWHALSSSIHEAQELGMHKSSPKAGLSEFNLEMRRRVWCLLYVWDWQMALLLSRPLIINQSYYSFEPPNMQLEGIDDGAGPPSPVAYIAVQLALGEIIIKIPGAIGGTIDTTYAEATRADIENWLVSLPPAYNLTNPDIQWDETYPYVPLHRRQLHAVGYMMMLLPFKRSLTECFDSHSSQTDRSLRESAVDVALQLMEVSHRLFDHVYPMNAKFHLVTFLIFDTAAFLCSAVIHDKDRSLPQRENVLQAIKLACSLMEKLAQITKISAICYPILVKLAKSLAASSKKTVTNNDTDLVIPQLGTEQPNASNDLGAFSLNGTTSPELIPSLGSAPGSKMFMPASLDFPVPGMETPPITGVGDFSNLDIGQFDQIWDWQNLDLTLLSSLPT